MDLETVSVMSCYFPKSHTKVSTNRSNFLIKMPHRSLLFLLFLPFFPFFWQSQACQMLLQLVSQKVSVQSVISVVIMFQFKVLFFIYYFVVHDVYDILKLYRRQRIRSTSKRSLLPCKKRLFRYVRSKYRCNLTLLLSCFNLAKVLGYSLASFGIGLLLRFCLS